MITNTVSSGGGSTEGPYNPGRWTMHQTRRPSGNLQTWSTRDTYNHPEPFATTYQKQEQARDASRVATEARIPHPMIPRLPISPSRVPTERFVTSQERRVGASGDGGRGDLINYPRPLPSLDSPEDFPISAGTRGHRC